MADKFYGFFSDNNDVKIEEVNKNQKSNLNYSCETCVLYKTCHSPRMKYTGEGKLKILIIAEAPGKSEDEKGIQLIGESGQLLRSVLKEIGFDLDKHFWKTNVIRCRPPENKTPTPFQIDCCKKELFKTIEELNPIGIILLGSVALQGLLGDRIKGRISNISFFNWNGEVIPDQNLKKWVGVLYHPAFLLRNEKDKVLKENYKRDLKKIIDTMISEKVSRWNYEECVSIVKNTDDAIDHIRSYKEKELLVFDYETTGIKPHRKGHKIVSVSLSDGNSAVAFPFFNHDEFRKEWRRLMMNPNIGKIAQNYKFEEMWTETILGHKVINWVWDTMLAQHCIHNKKALTLKFWSYIRLGIISYDETVDKFITGLKPGENKKSDNRFNLIEKAPLDDLLVYDGYDSLFTYKIYEIQKEILTEGNPQFNGYSLFMEGTDHLLQAGQAGIRMNVEKAEQEKNKCTRHIKLLEEKIQNSEEVAKWKKVKKEKFNPRSGKQLEYMLFNILNVESGKITKKGNKATDKKVLETIDLPFVKDILKYKKWDKVKNTYIAQYERELVDGFLHPFYNLHTVDTFRSSASAPNPQNVPKRDKLTKKIVRSLIIPRINNRLIEYDYKQCEVVASCCYHHDPNLVAYVKNPKSNMHTDQAVEIFLQDREKITETERYLAKNLFVFAEFYGSYYELIAPEFWQKMPEESKQHLYDQGIKIFRDFEEHLREVENKFWKVKFPVYAEWKKQTYAEYERNGYVDLLTGFRCYGPMKKNEVLNYRIQGTAFHFLLWTFIQVSKNIENKKNSFLIGQIHDAILGDIHPDDEKEIDNLVIDYGTKKIREYWEWITVPLTIEKERSEINGDWSEMEKIKGE